MGSINPFLFPGWVSRKSLQTRLVVLTSPSALSAGATGVCLAGPSDLGTAWRRRLDTHFTTSKAASVHMKMMTPCPGSPPAVRTCGTETPIALVLGSRPHLHRPALGPAHPTSNTTRPSGSLRSWRCSYLRLAGDSLGQFPQLPAPHHLFSPWRFLRVGVCTVQGSFPITTADWQIVAAHLPHRPSWRPSPFTAASCSSRTRGLLTQHPSPRTRHTAGPQATCGRRPELVRCALGTGCHRRRIRNDPAPPKSIWEGLDLQVSAVLGCSLKDMVETYLE